MAAVTPSPIQGGTVSLDEDSAVFLRRMWSIVGLTLLGILAANLYEHQQTPIYQSNARLDAAS